MEFLFFWCWNNVLFIILNMIFVYFEWIEYIGVIILNVNGYIFYFFRVGSLLIRVFYFYVNIFYVQDFVYFGQEDRLKFYRKFIYFGFDFRFYSLKYIWMVYFICFVWLCFNMFCLYLCFESVKCIEV